MKNKTKVKIKMGTLISGWTSGVIAALSAIMLFIGVCGVAVEGISSISNKTHLVQTLEIAGYDGEHTKEGVNTWLWEGGTGNQFYDSKIMEEIATLDYNYYWLDIWGKVSVIGVILAIGFGSICGSSIYINNKLDIDYNELKREKK